MVAALAVGLLALVLSPIVAAWGADSGPPVQAVNQGWWSAFSGVVGLGGTPLQGLTTPPTEPAPDVPDGVLPVAMRFGQVDRVSAIGIQVNAPRGSTVQKLVLHLKESTANGVQQGTGAAIRACPITSFLTPENDGQSANMPQEDCNIAHADGVRADDGSWTFDLTPIAAAWLDPSGALSANGIRFDPVGSAPGTFQVGFTGVQDATFDADITPGTGAASDAFATPGGSTSSAGGTSFDTPLSGGDVSQPAPATPAPASSTPAASAPKRTVAPVAHHRSGTIGDTALALVLLVVGLIALALAAGWVLGPAGRAADAAPRRHGGVSRALGRA